MTRQQITITERIDFVMIASQLTIQQIGAVMLFCRGGYSEKESELKGNYVTTFYNVLVTDIPAIVSIVNS